MNRMRKVSKNIAEAVMIILVFTSAALAQLPDSDQVAREKDREARFNEIVKELNLTPEQKQAMTQQRSEERSRSGELRQKIRSLRDQITKELDKEVSDKAALDLLVGQLKELTAQRIEHQIGEIIALKQILTPDQFKKLNEMREKDKKSHKQGGRK
jgi:Spy/CpxP family protein refolding chaperone